MTKIIWKIIIFTCLSCTLTITSMAARIDGTAATINSEVITFSDIQKFRKDLSLRAELDPLIALFRILPDNTAEIRDFLIQEALISQKFPPSKEEIDSQVQGILKNNRIGIEKLKGLLQAKGIEFEDYRRLMGISIAKRKLMDRELRPLSIISDDEVKNYYYTAPEFIASRKKQKLLINYSLLQITLPDASIADSVYEKLLSGAGHEAVVAQFKDQGASSNSLSSIREDKLSQQIRGLLDGLKVGEFTKPISIGSSYLIIKISAISAPEDPAFEQVKEKIRVRLYQLAIVNQLKIWTTNSRRDAYIHVPKN